MSRIITGSSTIGLTLSSNPTTITGSIDTAYSGAIYGAATRNWTVVNSGLVESTASLGIRLAGAGNIINSGMILGKYEGVFIGQHGMATNSGTIAAASRGSGVVLAQSGTVNNQAGGQISGVYGVLVEAKGSILNQGTILGTGSFGAAISLMEGTVQNAAGGLISGPIGIDLIDSGTIVNAGTIATTAPGGTAIVLGSGSRNMLVIDPASTIIGAIADFTAHDVIDFANMAVTGETFADGELILGNGGSIIAALSLTGDLDSSEFTLSSDGAGGTRITLGLDTITAGITNGETLTAPQTTIAAGVTVSGPEAGVSGDSYNWALSNSGTILGGSAGIDLVNAGIIRNNASGLIDGAIGVRIGSGELIDAGTIASSAMQGTAIELLATTHDVGIVLDPGATLIGAITGFVAGDTIDLAKTSINGETFRNNVLTLSNNGAEVTALTLAGGFNTAEFGLAPDGKGGTVVTLNASETISGMYTAGLQLSALFTTITTAAQINTFGTAVSGAYGRDWTLINSGELNAAGIEAFNDIGVDVSNGQVTNTGTGLIRGGTGVLMSDGRFINNGYVEGLNHYGYGFIDFGSVYFSNASGGVINGGLGVHLQNDTAQNAGQITAFSTAAAGVNLIGNTTFGNVGDITGATGIELGTGSTVTNSGTIIGTGGNYYGAQSFKHVGLRMSGGNFANGAGGVIEGPTGVTLTSGTLLNSGTIMGVSGGYYLGHYDASMKFASEGAVIGGGSVTNAALGLISGATGVLLQGGILEDAGTIASTATRASAIAVQFGSHAATLILDPSAVVNGLIESFGTGDVIELAGIGSGATLSLSTDSIGDPVTTVGGGSNESVPRSLTFGGTDSFALLQIAGGAELLGNTQIIGNGETMAGGTIGPPFQLLVLDGGVDTGSTIIAGGSETIYAGGAVYIGAAVTSGLTLDTGSTEIIGSGVTLSGVTVATGITLTVDGTANGTVVNNGGTMLVAAGGVASGTTIAKGGAETVLAGGSAYITSATTPGLTFESGSTEIIGSGVTVSGAKIAAGVSLDVWGTANASKVSSGGMEFIYASGSIVNGSVLSGGMLTVYSGATVAGSLAISGGTALIDGTVASGVTTSFTGAGGSLELDNAGFAGAIKGFGTGDSIDLINLPFANGASLSFTEAKNNKSGVLTVDQQMKLTFMGSYTASNFTLSSGVMGGSLVAFTSGNTQA